MRKQDVFAYVLGIAIVALILYGFRWAVISDYKEDQISRCVTNGYLEKQCEKLVQNNKCSWECENSIVRELSCRQKAMYGMHEDLSYVDCKMVEDRAEEFEKRHFP